MKTLIDTQVESQLENETPKLLVLDESVEELDLEFELDGKNFMNQDKESGGPDRNRSKRSRKMNNSDGRKTPPSSTNYASSGPADGMISQSHGSADL